MQDPVRPRHRDPAEVPAAGVRVLVGDDLPAQPVREAVTLLLGPLDDESFTAVQDWIVSHGRAVVRRIQEDPDRLVELAADRHNARIDWFCGPSPTTPDASHDVTPKRHPNKSGH
ncbi:DUF4240 domain-containing protein [Micromonospora sp. CPCC 205546]|uniref:DUF4240 domain-containing protein n=1 Tax=Micromonospora sp. CPCC 205546 TaxID=3122397 RepID=UPI002FF0F6BB